MCQNLNANNDIVIILTATDAMWLSRGPENHQASIGVIWIGTGMLIVMKQSKHGQDGLLVTQKTFSQLGLWKNFPQTEKFLLLKIW